MKLSPHTLYSIAFSVTLHNLVFLSFYQISNNSDHILIGWAEQRAASHSSATEVAFIQRERPATVQIQPPTQSQVDSPVKIKRRTAKKPTPKESPKKKTQVSSASRQATGVFNLAQQAGTNNPQLSRYFQHLMVKIEQQKRYPKMAKRLNQAGKVIVRFEISKAGTISNVMVEKPCRFKKLNVSAKRLIEELKNTRPIPETLNYAKFSVAIPIEYRL